MGKLIEGLWDCPFCDNKRIKAGQKTCPLCGHPQDENTKFYMPDAIEYVSEEKAAKISRNPDWQCSFFGSLNSDNLNICKNCGATKEDSERNYFEIRKQEEEKKRKKEAHQKDTANCHWLSRYLIPKPGLQDRTDSDESLLQKYHFRQQRYKR